MAGEKTQKDKINEIHVVMLGVPGTADKGFVGDVKEIKTHLDTLNGQVRANTFFRKIGTWISGAMFLALVSLLVKLLT